MRRQKINQQKNVKMQKMSIGIELDDEPLVLPPRESSTTVHNTNEEPSR
jgi:hypothetical protein